MADRPSADELRRLVREVLREALGEVDTASGDRQPTLADGLARAARGGEFAFTVSSEKDLVDLLHAAATASGNDDLAHAVKSGRLRLSLGAAPRGRQAGSREGAPADAKGGGARHKAPTKQPAHVEKGVISETRVAALAKDHSKLVLGKTAVLTPLAKDKARELNLAVERGRS